MLRSSDPLRLDSASDVVDFYSVQQAALSCTATTGPALAPANTADTGDAGHKQLA